MSLTKLTEKEILEAISPAKQNAEKQDESVDSKLTVPPSVIVDDIVYFTRSRVREKPIRTGRLPCWASTSVQYDDMDQDTNTGKDPKPKK